MTREKKLEAIYQEMANKELTPWCCVEVKAQNEYGDFTYRLSRWDERPTSEIKEIIGHPVMIWDVLSYCSSYISDWDDSVDSQIDLLSYWGDYRLPIEDQPEECIDFVHSQTLKS